MIAVVRAKYLDIAPEAVAPADVKEMNFAEIANLIRKDWKKLSPYAKPYVDAMGDGVLDATGKYYEDSKADICLYFCANAAGWRGPLAKLVKAELKARCGYGKKGGR